MKKQKKSHTSLDSYREIRKPMPPPSRKHGGNTAKKERKDKSWKKEY